MDDFDFYRLYKTLHVLSVILLAGGVGIESVIGPLMARATSVQELRAYARLSRIAELYIMLPAFLLIAGFGYATAGRINLDIDTTWLLIAQIVFYAAVVISVGYLMQVSLGLWRKVKDLPDGPVPAALARELANPLPGLMGALLTVALVFIVYLMVAKPSW
jgi:hypothetical protein